MQDATIAFVLTGAASSNLGPLTQNQPKALVRFGGAFRIFDFALSNLLNSKLRRIYILPLDGDARIGAYVREGWAQLSKEFRWDRGEDLACLEPERNIVAQALSMIEASRAENVLIVSGEQVYQMDYGQLLSHHIDSHADVTTSVPGVLVFRHEAIVQLLRKGSGFPPLGRTGRRTSFNVSGYWRDIQNVDDYFAANMDLLARRLDFDPYFNRDWPTRTLTGTSLLQENRYATNSRVSLGARIAPCTITNSVVSPGVRIENGAVVENCVILSGSQVGPGARVRNAVIAENVTIPRDAEVGHGEHQLTVVADSDPARRQYIQRRCARVGAVGQRAASR